MHNLVPALSGVDFAIMMYYVPTRFALEEHNEVIV
jgi:hypothetical protein